MMPSRRTGSRWTLPNNANWAVLPLVTRRLASAYATATVVAGVVSAASAAGSSVVIGVSSLISQPPPWPHVAGLAAIAVVRVRLPSAIPPGSPSHRQDAATPSPRSHWPPLPDPQWHQVEHLPSARRCSPRQPGSPHRGGPPSVARRHPGNEPAPPCPATCRRDSVRLGARSG